VTDERDQPLGREGLQQPSEPGSAWTPVRSGSQDADSWAAFAQADRRALGEQSRIIATLDNGPTVLAAYSPQPDYAEWEAWKRILRQGDLFVDVGANVGIYTILAHERGAETISVEPVPANVRRLKANLALNGYASEIWVSALWAESTTLQFSSDLDAATNHITDDAAGDGTTKVHGETLDTVLGTRRARGVKVDVEGAERQVLLGARRALAAGQVDVWQLEWNATAHTHFGESRAEAANLLAAYGYRLHRPRPDGELVPTDAGEGSDVFAVREGFTSQ
jgi:FkbM family methyltransferase